MERFTITADQINENYNKLIQIINYSFSANIERRDKLLKLVNDFEIRLATCPASSIGHFHGCYSGGLVVHILNVIKTARKLYTQWKELGGNMNGYTLENLDFVCLTHDLGKLGDLKNDFYELNDTDWQVKNQNKIYKINTDLQQMDHVWRTIYLLNQYEIKMSAQEYMAIMTHDGMFRDDNKDIFVNFDKDKLPKTNLMYLLHFADFMSYRIELEKEGIVNPKEIEL